MHKGGHTFFHKPVNALVHGMYSFYIIWLHHLDEHSLVEGSKAFGMSHQGNFPWPCHVEMHLGNVGALPDFFDMALMGDHLHVGHPGTRHNLCLLNRQALWVRQMQLQRRKSNRSWLLLDLHLHDGRCRRMHEGSEDQHTDTGTRQQAPEKGAYTHDSSSLLSVSDLCHRAAVMDVVWA